MVKKAITGNAVTLFLILALCAGVAGTAQAAGEKVVRMESEILEVVTLRGPEYQFGAHVNVPRTARLQSRKTGSDGFETELQVTDAYEAPEPRRYTQARIKEAGLTLSPVQTIINEIPGVSDYEESVDFRLPLQKLPEGQDLTIQLIAEIGENREFRLPARYIAMQRQAIAGE